MPNSRCSSFRLEFKSYLTHGGIMYCTTAPIIILVSFGFQPFPAVADS